MAETKDYVIKLTVDDGGAIKNIDSVEKSLTSSAKSATSVKAELRAIQQELAKFEQGSEEFTKLSLRAGELKDRINDASEAIRANAGNSIETLSNNVGNLGNRFATLDFDGITQDFKGIAGSIGNIKADDLSKGIKNAGSAFASLGKALLTNPIFLVAAAIIGIGAAFVALKDKIKPIGAIFDAVGDVINSVIAKVEAFLQILGLTASEAEKANQAIIDSSQEVISTIDKRYDREIKLAQAAGKETIFLEIEKRKAQLKTIDEVVKALIAKGTIEGSLNEEELKKIQELKQQKLDIETDLQATILAETRKNNEKRAADEQKVVEARKRSAEERKKAEQDLAKEQQRIAEEALKEAQRLAEEAKKIAEEQERARLDALVKANEERIKLQDAQFALEEELALTAQEKEVAAVVAAYEEKFLVAQGNAKLEKKLAEQQRIDIAAINDKYDADEKAKQEALLQSKVDFAASTLGTLQNITNSFTAKNEAQAKKQFQINKGISIAQASIETYKSANAAFAAATASPITTAFPAYPFIQAGLAVAAGLANVKKIASTQFGGGAPSASSAGGGSVSAGGGGSAAPTFNPVNTQFLNNRPPQATPAYVLSGAVTDAQVADQKIKEQARL